jgi:hypothetical protein
MKYYPENDTTPFYVEFERGNKNNEFTLFRRQYMYSEEDFDKLSKDNPKEFIFMQNELHPWNLFTSTYGPDGCTPDQKWICWMVDALNEKVKNDKIVFPPIIK